ncbi:CRAL/TRIO domain-containing protein [Toxoplasma gondii VEG]|uniref:CRAL/TRIO domain-containing protein n=3 Tax=Toxoplasma gondii TaxID=5811 RepID=V4Z889_TOXGV|nr:CRAL/TRIO domain-containing protein [Toxoplasma gondii VEG]
MASLGHDGTEGANLSLGRRLTGKPSPPQPLPPPTHPLDSPRSNERRAQAEKLADASVRQRELQLRQRRAVHQKQRRRYRSTEATRNGGNDSQATDAPRGRTQESFLGLLFSLSAHKSRWQRWTENSGCDWRSRIGGTVSWPSRWPFGFGDSEETDVAQGAPDLPLKDRAHARGRSSDPAEHFSSDLTCSPRTLHLPALVLPDAFLSPASSKTPRLSPIFSADQEEDIPLPDNSRGGEDLGCCDARVQPTQNAAPSLHKGARRDCRRSSQLSPSEQRLPRGSGLAARPTRTLSFKTEPFVAVTLDLSPLTSTNSPPSSPLSSTMAEDVLPLEGTCVKRGSSAASALQSPYASSSAAPPSPSSSYVLSAPLSCGSSPNLLSWSSLSPCGPASLGRLARKNSGGPAGEVSGACVPGANDAGGKGSSVSPFLREPLPPFFLQEGPTPAMVDAFYQFIEVAHDIRQAVLLEINVSSRPRSRSGGDSTTIAEDVSAAEAAHVLKEPSSSLEVEELAGTYRLLRFLQGYDFNVSEAAQAYKRHVIWRITQRIDNAMRDFILREMVLPLTPEKAVDHAAVSRNFPNNQLLRCSKQTERVSETKSSRERPLHAFEAVTSRGTALPLAPDAKNRDESKGEAKTLNEQQDFFCRYGSTSSAASSSTSASSCISSSSFNLFSSSPGSSSACGPSGSSREVASPPDGNLFSFASPTVTPQILLDRQGNIITVARPGLLDERRLFEEVSEDTFLKWHCYQLEFRNILLDRLSRQKGRLVQATSILDLEGLSARSINRHALGILRQLIYVTSENYPESLSHIFFINTPRLFSAVWGTLQGWLKERTVAKIHILEGDYEAELHKYIDPACLPPSLGGVCTSPLACIRTFSKTELLSARLGGGHSILHIGARRREHVDFEVPKGACLSWAWVLVEHDVSFQVKWRPAAGNEERPMLEMKKHQGSRVVRGSIKADQDGTVSLIFDNSWGLFSHRTIFYKLHLEDSATPAACS